MKTSFSPAFCRLEALVAGLLVLCVLGVPAVARAQAAAPFTSQETLATLLQKGELTLVETKPNSNLKQVTAIALVKRPAEEVWLRLIDYAGYRKWMPKLSEASVVKREGSATDVQWEVEVPGPNYRYVARNIEDKAQYMLRQHQVSGALSGSHWSWQLVPQGPSATLVFRTVFTNVTDESWIARQLEDDSHTLSYGINVSTSLLEVRALRRAAEQRK